MDRAARIERTALDIKDAEGRIERQKERIASLDVRGMHTAAALARETLMAMVDFLAALGVKHSIMVDTASVLEKTRQAIAKKKADHTFVCRALSAPVNEDVEAKPDEIGDRPSRFKKLP